MVTVIEKIKAKTIPEATKEKIIAPILEEIRARHSGLLMADDVVEEARQRNSPLHPYFNWNDTKAAHQYRLWQARQLITVVTIKLPNARKLIQMYVSLHKDRKQPDGAYRGILDVMSDKDLRYQLVMEALDDLKYWEKKYSQMAELTEIYNAIQTTRKKFRKK